MVRVRDPTTIALHWRAIAAQAKRHVQRKYERKESDARLERNIIVFVGLFVAVYGVCLVLAPIATLLYTAVAALPAFLLLCVLGIASAGGG